MTAIDKTSRAVTDTAPGIANFSIADAIIAPTRDPLGPEPIEAGLGLAEKGGPGVAVEG